MSLNKELPSNFNDNLHIGAPFANVELPPHLSRIVQYSGAYYGQAEIDAVNQVLERGWLGPGQEAFTFEKELAQVVGTKYAHAVNSGSSANLLALAGLSLPEHTKVIVPACSFPTTVNPIVQLHLTPLFIETDLETLNPNLDQLLSAMKIPGVSAAIFAHTLGNPNPMDIIMEEARRHGVKVVEDNCDALGSLYKNKSTGTFGDVSTLSMYPAHHFTTMGEGGGVFTNSLALSSRVKMLRDWGRGCWCADRWEAPCSDRFGFKLLNGTEWDHRYFWQSIGYNLGLTEAQAAFGRIQLLRLPGFIEARRRNFDALYHYFENHWQHLFILPKTLPDASPSWFGFPLTIRDGISLKRNQFQRDLEHFGIQSRTHFGGNVLLHPAYQGIAYETLSPDLAVSNKIAKDTFFLGVWQGIVEDDLNYMFTVFDKLLKDLR